MLKRICISFLIGWIKPIENGKLSSRPWIIKNILIALTTVWPAKLVENGLLRKRESVLKINITNLRICLGSMVEVKFQIQKFLIKKSLRKNIFISIYICQDTWSTTTYHIIKYKSQLYIGYSAAEYSDITINCFYTVPYSHVTILFFQ